MGQIGRHRMPNMKRAAWGFMQSGSFPVPILHLKLSENTGEDAFDSSPEGHDMTLSGCTWVKGYLGHGLYFDGLDDYLHRSNLSEIHIDKAYTIEFMVKFDAVVAAQCVIQHGSPNSNRLNMRLLSSRISVAMYDGAAWVSKKRSDAALVAETWYHIVYVHEADGTAYLYINGVSQADEDSSTSVSGVVFRIGVRGDGAQDFKGYIDEIIFYAAVLTPGQVRSRYQGFR